MFQLIHMFEMFHNKKLNWVKLDRVELFFFKILYSMWNKNLLSTKFVICLQCGRPGFNLWVGKIHWRREWLCTPVFWPGEFHGLYCHFDLVSATVLMLNIQINETC